MCADCTYKNMNLSSYVTFMRDAYIKLFSSPKLCMYPELQNIAKAVYNEIIT